MAPPGAPGAQPTQTDGATAREARRPDGAPAAAPRIRYARTADGASIAFWTLGRGAPLVYLAGGPWSHVELWQLPECRRWYERLAAHRLLVRYDPRGTGLSGRDVADYTLEALVLDLEAVVDRLELPRFALFGAADGGLVALAYAARHPERVSGLVLWCAWARTAAITSPRVRAWLGLLDQDWELTTETCAHLALGWSAGEAGRRAAAGLRESVTPEGLRAALEAAAAYDVTALLPRVAAPVLVLHRRGIPWLPVGLARDLASRLRDARLVLLEGESTAPYLGDAEAIARASDAFLAEADRAPAARVAAGAPAAGAPLATLPGRPTTAPGVSASTRETQGTQGTQGSRRLTARETEVLRLLAGGHTNHEIAAALVLSVRTVERHVANIYRKIGARGRAHATAYALGRSLV